MSNESGSRVDDPSSSPNEIENKRKEIKEIRYILANIPNNKIDQIRNQTAVISNMLRERGAKTPDQPAPKVNAKSLLQNLSNTLDELKVELALLNEQTGALNAIIDAQLRMITVLSAFPNTNRKKYDEDTLTVEPNISEEIPSHLLPPKTEPIISRGKIIEIIKDVPKQAKDEFIANLEKENRSLAICLHNFASERNKETTLTPHVHKIKELTELVNIAITAGENSIKSAEAIQNTLKAKQVSLIELENLRRAAQFDQDETIGAIENLQKYLKDNAKEFTKEKPGLRLIKAIITACQKSAEAAKHAVILAGARVATVHARRSANLPDTSAKRKAETELHKHASKALHTAVKAKADILKISRKLK